MAVWCQWHTNTRLSRSVAPPSRGQDLGPVHDVVGVQEPGRIAVGCLAVAVAFQKCSSECTVDDSAAATQRQGVAVGVAHHGLDRCVASQPAGQTVGDPDPVPAETAHLRRRIGTVALAGQLGEPDMDRNPRSRLTIRRRFQKCTRQDTQCVGPTCADGVVGSGGRAGGDQLGCLLQGGGDDGAGLGVQLTIETQRACGGPPRPQPPATTRNGVGVFVCAAGALGVAARRLQLPRRRMCGELDELRRVLVVAGHRRNRSGLPQRQPARLRRVPQRRQLPEPPTDVDQRLGWAVGQPGLPRQELLGRPTLQRMPIIQRDQLCCDLRAASVGRVDNRPQPDQLGHQLVSWVAALLHPHSLYEHTFDTNASWDV